jgi:hypothetical protein
MIGCLLERRVVKTVKAHPKWLNIHQRLLDRFCKANSVTLYGAFSRAL